MKKFSLALILVMGWLSVLAFHAFAQSRLDFILANETGFDVLAVSLQHVSGLKYLTVDFGKEGGLPDGRRRIIRFREREEGRNWNIMVTFQGNVSYIIRNVDLIQAGGIILTFRNGQLFGTIIPYEE